MISSDVISSTRIEQRLMKLAEIGKKADGGVHRMALSEEDWRAQELVTKWMNEAGLTVRRDNFGNLIGRREGRKTDSPVIMLGSHIDSVPNGGQFDGTIGVIGAIEAVQAIHDAGVECDHPIEVVAFCDEEGPRFFGGLFGSRGMIGRISYSELQQQDEAGITRYQAIQSFGLDPDNIEESIRKPGDIRVYLEMHIEQGPYLESINRPVGIVTGIAGPVWLRIQLLGEAGHAGTVPMYLRRDPMVGAAEIIQSIERICAADPAAPTVGTVGKIKANPGGGNVIPESVEFTVDIRDIDLARREQVIAELKSEIHKICEKRNLEVSMEETLNIRPIHCSSDVIQKMENANRNLGLSSPLMVSGAGHDAMLMGEITEMGMIFVRCRGGISHSPKEWADKEDIAKGVQLLLETMKAFI